MRRRRLLALTALPLAMAGCLADETEPANGNGDDDPDDTDDDSDDDGDDTADGTNDDDDDPSDNDEPTDRVDEPPHEIERPDPGDEDDWNDHYLGEQMDEEPSLAFDVITSSRRDLPGFPTSEATVGEYRADLLTSAEALEDLLDTDEMSEETRERVDAVEFETHVLVLVRSGWGSGSRRHQWVRVEDVAGGVHLHGYYTDPFIQTDDWTWRASLVEVKRPDADPDLARVSLTINEDERVNFDSTEETVLLEE